MENDEHSKTEQEQGVNNVRPFTSRAARFASTKSSAAPKNKDGSKAIERPDPIPSRRNEIIGDDDPGPSAA